MANSLHGALGTSSWELRCPPWLRSTRPQSEQLPAGRAPGGAAPSGPYLELVCVVEVHAHGGHHPGLEERRQDLLSDGVGDEVEVQRVPPVGRERKPGQEGARRPRASQVPERREKEGSVVYQPRSLWHFVTVAPTN